VSSDPKKSSINQDKLSKDAKLNYNNSPKVSDEAKGSFWSSGSARLDTGGCSRSEPRKNQSASVNVNSRRYNGLKTLNLI
jgi:hypothetical protein